MSQVLVMELKAQKILKDLVHPLSVNNDYFNDSRITPLTRRYFGYHAAFKGQKDYQPTQLAFMTKCSIFDTLRIQGGTSLETAIVCDLFGGHIPSFEQLLYLHGRMDLISDNLSLELKKYRATRRQPTGCTSIESVLSQFLGKYKCNQGCGVSSPAALAYLPIPPFQHPISFEDEHFSLDATGLYSVEPERNRKTRVMNPIWVQNTLPANQDDLGAREVVYYDVNGFVNKLTIKEDVIDSSKFFPLLRSKGIQVPNDTILRGKLRQYLASQFPPKQVNAPAIYFTDTGGWQNDNSFIFPGDNGSTVSGYVRQSQIVPAGEKSRKLLPPASIGEATADPYILLATLASLSAPYLKHRELTGLNLHFHGGTEAGRAAIIHAACSVWNQMPYVFADAKQHEVALKMQHKDAALGILEVPAAKTKAMNTLVRRYFNGRKGGDSGVRGIIVSCGETPMGQSTNRENGFHVFTYKNNVLGIDIWLGNLSSQGFRFNHTATKAIVQQLATNSSIHLEKIQANESRLKKQQGWATSPRPNRQVSDYLHFFMALGYVDQVSLQSWWRGDPLVSVFDQFMTGIDARDALFYGLLKQMNLSMPLPDILRELGASSITSFIEIDRHRILVPSKEMSKIAKDKPTLLRFISWLKARKILIPKRTGDLCGGALLTKAQEDASWLHDLPQLLP